MEEINSLYGDIRNLLNFRTWLKLLKHRLKECQLILEGTFNSWRCDQQIDVCRPPSCLAGDNCCSIPRPANGMTESVIVVSCFGPSIEMLVTGDDVGSWGPVCHSSLGNCPVYPCIRLALISVKLQRHLKTATRKGDIDEIYCKKIADWKRNQGLNVERLGPGLK